ncbi:hypothetical protein RHGRI_023697 [Rhododendron griersonianum]|uniref:Uncharacterized protein n=1 Tax=Rhododendron griersonianum TaxID=479676 RepID=A0AAV6J4Q8_9ERIC|nr:hypothetical protein RHGRI_023697 [Rhododendron griersonianum]
MKHTEREREQQEHAATNSDDFGDFDEDYEELRLFRRRTPQGLSLSLSLSMCVSLSFRMRTRNPNPLCSNTGERRTKSISDEASRRRRRTPQGTTRKIGERRDEFRKKVSRCVRKSQEML